MEVCLGSYYSCRDEARKPQNVIGILVVYLTEFCSHIPNAQTNHHAAPTHPAPDRNDLPFLYLHNRRFDTFTKSASLRIHPLAIQNDPPALRHPYPYTAASVPSRASRNGSCYWGH